MDRAKRNVLALRFYLFPQQRAFDFLSGGSSPVSLARPASQLAVLDVDPLSVLDCGFCLFKNTCADLVTVFALKVKLIGVCVSFSFKLYSPFSPYSPYKGSGSALFMRVYRGVPDSKPVFTGLQTRIYRTPNPYFGDSKPV